MALQMLNIISSQEIGKRVPQGFLGVRGKKFYDTDGIDHFYKRKPQFFVGVKGKKNLMDYLASNEQYEKRAPMGFVGMRGKKDSDDDLIYSPAEYIPRQGSLIGQIDYTSNEDFPNMEFLNQLLFEYQKLKQSTMDSNEMKANESNELPFDGLNDLTVNSMTKRAAKMHQFYGMRGKKVAEAKRPFDLSFRGKFVGVRGKKDGRNSMNEIKFLLDREGPWPKRKGQMNGFFGMRGKKWVDGERLFKPFIILSITLD